MHSFWSVGKGLVLLLLTPALSAAQSAAPGDIANTVREVQQYGFAIHILAMLLVGFGFLMVFANRYGYGAVTGTYLVVAAGVPLYIGLRASGVLSAEAVEPHSIKALLLAEFAVASALIAAGAVLGRLRLYQYALLAVVMIPFYMLNERLVLDGGLGVTKGFTDAAGSISIHAFGAYFGLGLAVALTSQRQRNVEVSSDAASNRFSMIGSMHGMPGLFGGLAAIVVLPGMAAAQLTGIAVTLVLALLGGLVSGFVIRATGAKQSAYEDAEDFANTEEQAVAAVS